MAHLLRKKIFPFKKILLLIMLVVSSTVMFGHGYDFFEQDKMVKTVKCYPNPANAFINFEFDKNVDKTAVLQVFSLSGKKILESSTSTAKITVQLDNFFRGLYVYQLRDKSGRILESGKFQVVK